MAAPLMKLPLERRGDLSRSATSSFTAHRRSLSGLGVATGTASPVQRLNLSLLGGSGTALPSPPASSSPSPGSSPAHGHGPGRAAAALLGGSPSSHSYSYSYSYSCSSPKAKLATAALRRACSSPGLSPASTTASGLDRSLYTPSTSPASQWQLPSPQSTGLRGDSSLLGASFHRSDLRKTVTPSEVLTWRAAIRRDWRQLARAPHALRSERRLVLEAVQQDPRAFGLASEQARDNLALAYEAVRVGGGLAFKGASERVRSDRALLLEAVRSQGLALAGIYLAVHREDPEIVSEAVKQDWRALAHAADKLKNNKEIALMAVRQSWQALQWLPDRFYTDRDIMMTAIAQHPEALQWADESIRRDPFCQRLEREAGLQVVCSHKEASTPRCHCGHAYLLG